MNRLNHIFILLLILGCSKAKVKTKSILYDESIAKAKESFKNKEYLKALDNYENAFEIIPYKEKKDYFYAAAAAFHLKNDEKATDLIISAIKNLYVYENNLLSFDDFKPFMTNEFFKDIQYTFPSLRKQIASASEHSAEIDKEIDSLIAEDQRVREGSLEQKPRNYFEIKDMIRVDSLNINRVIKITQEYGWHPRMWLLLWHHRGSYKDDNYVWNYFRPFINKQIEKGNIKKSFWARYEDDKSINEKGVQVYGMYAGQSERFPIEDIKNLDFRRETMGLTPLWYSHLINKIKLPETYKNTVTSHRYKNKYEKIKT